MSNIAALAAALAAGGLSYLAIGKSFPESFRPFTISLLYRKIEL